MNEEEKTALQKVHITLLHDLDASEVLPHLFQNGMISAEEYEEIDELNDTQTGKCKRLLRVITRPNSNCTFQGFLQSLRYNDVYSFLAKPLQQKLDEILKSNGDRDSGTPKEESAPDYPDQEKTERLDIMYEPVRKINVFTKKRIAMSKLAHKLKRLSHEGDNESFQKVVETIDRKYQRNKLDWNKNIGDRMELADMKFTSLEAEISAKRVRYDTSLGDGDAFRHLESVIPFTTNPRVSSMTYLARYGSAIAMKESIDEGLAYVQFAKEHAEYVTPCKDTGMVYYIEVNLLSQKYENNPSDHLKANILRTSEQGIAQFNGENDEIRKDYQRMLLLKMVYCYLGVGLFCRKIDNVHTTESDKDAAKKVIDFIETSDVWQGMEKRRKMLFYVAKSVYYQHQGNDDLAVVHAKEAEKLGKENKWNAELTNISELINELQNRQSPTPYDKVSQTGEDIIAELFEDSDSENETRDVTSERLCSAAAQVGAVNMEQKDLHDLCPFNAHETEKLNLQMVDLKQFSGEACTEASSDYQTSHRITDLKPNSDEYGIGSSHSDFVQRPEESTNIACKCAENRNHETTYAGGMGNVMTPRLSYLKPEENDLSGEGTEMEFLKKLYGMKCMEESLPRSDFLSPSHNIHDMMLLKEQCSTDETQSNLNLNLSLPKENKRITSQSLNSSITGSSTYIEIPPPAHL